MSLLEQTTNTFTQLSNALQLLTNTTYKTPNKILGNASIGSHVRHIVEMYECLLLGVTTGLIDYDNRKRNTDIENDKEFALALISSLQKKLAVENMPLTIKHNGNVNENSTAILTQTNYNRELLYNIEHTIHHMALIRIGIETATDVSLCTSFGYAPSTINYRKQCAQ
jgi:hypothetical protein